MTRRATLPIVAAAGHVTEVMGPVQALYNYLRSSDNAFSFAMHPFSFCSIPKSRLERWRLGRLVSNQTVGAPRSLSIARDLMVNLIFFGGEHSDVFVGIDNVNAFSGLMLRALRRTKRVVYYVIDYTPVRFNNKLLNWVYHAVDAFVVANADEVWNISERIAAIRTRQGLPDSRNRVVGVGVDLAKIPPPAIRNLSDFVFVSYLTESKGVQLAIRAMRSVRERVPSARLLIVGTGPYEAELRRLSEELGMLGSVEFVGLLGHDRLFEFLRTCGVALAPYLDDPNSISYFADPTKPKEYLACGLPVIITDVPWIAEPISSLPMGLTIRYDERELAEAMIKLATDSDFNERCSVNARNFAASLDWNSIYDKATESW